MAVKRNRPGSSHLSPQELLVLRHITDGLLDKEGATLLGLSTETFRSYKKRIRAKYRLRGVPIHNDILMLKAALADGYITLEIAAPPAHIEGKDWLRGKK